MITRKQYFATTALFVIVMLFNPMTATPKTPSDLSKTSVIPKPVSITATGRYFELRSHSDIYIHGESKELKQIGNYLADKLKQSTGFGIDVITTEKTPGSGNIYLTLSENNPGSKPGDEGYELLISKKLVLLSANSPAGLFRGIQTIIQLFPGKD